MNFNELKVGIIGLGYVGLPLAVEFGKITKTVGYDINSKRVGELRDYIDSTLECTREELLDASLLHYTDSLSEISDCNVYIVTVPTPIDEHKRPDLTPLIKASESIGKVIDINDVVIYESTVYPGATEEECVPILESISGLKFNCDFFVGYSPERINPGDKEHRVSNIFKVTSGSTPETADFVDKLYNMVIKAGTHKCPSIKVAEASKVIENVQRDVNIALINELHQIFERMGIDTKAVIEAASTKWNFMKLMPGLVGGHCIGVDPYYLLHKSNSYGYIPDLMRTAREVNDGFSEYLANSFLRELVIKGINPVNTKVLLLGLSFKENCPDIRNTKVFDLYKNLVKLGISVDIYDPWVNKEEVAKEYGLTVYDNINELGSYDVGFLAVPHERIISDIREEKIKLTQSYVYDYKRTLVD